MDVEEKLKIINQKPVEEILTIENLEHLLEIGVPLKHYIGFEISGIPHIGAALMQALVIRNLQKINAKCRIFLADYHTWMNNKLGGDLDFIRKVGKEFFGQVLLDSIDLVGGNSEKVDLILGSELYSCNDDYWRLVIDVSKNMTLTKAKKSISIAGRKEGESVSFAQLVYVPMQVADIFELESHIAHAGTDQRKAHVIALEVYNKIFKPLKHNNEILQPVAIHHHLVMGLQKPPFIPNNEEELKKLKTEMKMSKSKPNSAIFVTDSEEEIRKKIKNAFCPAKDTRYNPVLDWVEYLVFTTTNEFTIERPEKFGGTITYNSFEELKKDFKEGKLHPLDLKNALADYLVKLLKPLYTKYKDHPLVEEIKKKITR
ncbi:MAG: tyrosine--tRNA ligase [Nanoarchaeota archaeon]